MSETQDELEFLRARLIWALWWRTWTLGFTVTSVRPPRRGEIAVLYGGLYPMTEGEVIESAELGPYEEIVRDETGKAIGIMEQGNPDDPVLTPLVDLLK